MADIDTKDGISQVVPIDTDAEVSEYANGLQVAFGNADIIVTFQKNGQTIRVMNMSFTLAKTLSQMLGGLIDNIETKGDFKIRTTKELDTVLTPEFKEKKH